MRKTEEFTAFPSVIFFHAWDLFPKYHLNNFGIQSLSENGRILILEKLIDTIVKKGLFLKLNKVLIIKQRSCNNLIIMESFNLFFNPHTHMLKHHTYEKIL